MSYSKNPHLRNCGLLLSEICKLNPHFYKNQFSLTNEAGSYMKKIVKLGKHRLKPKCALEVHDHIVQDYKFVNY